MTYEIRLSPRAGRALQRELPERIATAVAAFLFGPIAENPRRLGRPLGGSMTGQWSARRGTYRVVYEIDDEQRTVTVLRISHRGIVYR